MTTAELTRYAHREFDEIDRLLSDMLRGVPLPRPPELNALALRALESLKKKEPDLAAWARRLANDVADATD